MSASFPDVVELNVGGVFYTTALSTLTKDSESLLGQIFTGQKKPGAVKDSKGKYFLDRDGVLFRYILDYLRNEKLVLPENFHERNRLRYEAEYFELKELVECLDVASGKAVAEQTEGLSINSRSGVIMVGYRGTFAFGRDGLADVKFRKLSRIIVAGRINLCREVFGDTLNESRDPDRGQPDRYTSRFFLKHTFLEQAFDMLLLSGFQCIASCGSSTAGVPQTEMKPGMDSEESRWNHYNEFFFSRLL